MGPWCSVTRAWLGYQCIWQLQLHHSWLFTCENGLSGESDWVGDRTLCARASRTCVANTFWILTLSQVLGGHFYMSHFIQFSGDSEPGTNHSSVHQDSLDPGQTEELYSVPSPPKSCLSCYCCFCSAGGWSLGFAQARQAFSHRPTPPASCSYFLKVCSFDYKCPSMRIFPRQPQSLKRMFYPRNLAEILLLGV